MTNLINDFRVNYIPARICDGKEYLVKYYVRHPIDGLMKKKTIRFNHLKGKYNKTDIIRQMRAACNQINIDLAAGKNPFIEADSPKSYHLLKDAIAYFLKIKMRDMRPDGMRSYLSFCNKLLAWIENKGMKDCYVISFTKDKAIEMMNELTLNENISNRTWNNHFVFYRSLWNWFIENQYCKINVFISFKKKREERKIRELIPNAIHKKIVNYCIEINPHLEIVIHLVRASFVRPKEICNIQIKEIDLIRKVILIPSEKAKTHNDRFAYLPDWLIEKIISLYHLDRYKPDDYLVSTGLLPGRILVDTRYVNKFWSKMRTELKLPMVYQLYSYRDTGITTLENSGIPESVIIKLTDHRSVKMARKYIHEPNINLIENVVSKIEE